MQKNLQTTGFFKKLRVSAVIFTMITLLFTGCGSSTDEENGATYNIASSSTSAAIDSSLYGALTADTAELKTDTTADDVLVARNAELTVTVSDLENFDADLYVSLINSGGYFEESEINDYSSSYSSSRWAYYTVRVPQEKLNDFIEQMEQSSTVTKKTISAEDVSLNYADITARINALEAERDSLTNLLKETTNVSDIITIENALAKVQSSLDSYGSKKKILENRVAYSIVQVSAKEDRTVKHPFIKAFSVNFKKKMLDGMNSAAITTVNFITSIPVIIVTAAFCLLFIWILRKVWRMIFKERKKIHYVLAPVTFEPQKTKKKRTKNKESLTETPDKETERENAEEILDKIMETKTENNVVPPKEPEKEEEVNTSNTNEFPEPEVIELSEEPENVKDKREN